MSEVNLAGLCKGSTADSDSVCEGSNPSPAAMKKAPRRMGAGLFLFPYRSDCLRACLKSLKMPGAGGRLITNTDREGREAFPGPLSFTFYGG